MGVTWLQHKQNLLIAEEQRQSANERAKILEDFKELQKKVPFIILVGSVCGEKENHSMY